MRGGSHSAPQQDASVELTRMRAEIDQLRAAQRDRPAAADGSARVE